MYSIKYVHIKRIIRNRIEFLWPWKSLWGQMSRLLTMLLSYKLYAMKWKGSSSFEFGVKSVLFSFGNEVDKENNKFPQTQICWRCCTLWVNDCLEKLEAWRNKWREEGTEKENHRRAFVLYFPHCRWFCVLGN